MLLLFTYTLFTGISLSSLRRAPTFLQRPKPIYDATPTQRLTLSPIGERIELANTTITCLESDRYRNNAFIFCDGEKFNRYRFHPETKLKIKSVDIDMTQNIKALQINNSNWLVLSRFKNCLCQVSFYTRSYTEIAGCRRWGDADGIGTDAKFNSPRDMVFSIHDNNTIYVLTEESLRAVSLNTKQVSTPSLFGTRQTLPEGLTRMMWVGQNLTFVSPLTYYRLRITSDGVVRGKWNSNVNPIFWESAIDAFKSGTSFNPNYYIADVVSTGKPKVYLAGFIGANFKIIDLVRRISPSPYYNNDCVGEESTALAFNRRTRLMATSYSKYICIMRVEWTNPTITATTPETTTMVTPAKNTPPTATTVTSTVTTTTSTTTTPTSTINPRDRAATKVISTMSKNSAITTTTTSTSPTTGMNSTTTTPTMPTTTINSDGTAANNMQTTRNDWNTVSSTLDPLIFTDYWTYFGAILWALALVSAMILLAFLAFFIRKKKKRRRGHRKR